jgi:hypothetical protein
MPNPEQGPNFFELPPEEKQRLYDAMKQQEGEQKIQPQPEPEKKPDAKDQPKPEVEKSAEGQIFEARKDTVRGFLEDYKKNNVKKGKDISEDQQKEIDDALNSLDKKKDIGPGLEIAGKIIGGRIEDFGSGEVQSSVTTADLRVITYISETIEAAQGKIESKITILDPEETKLFVDYLDAHISHSEKKDGKSVADDLKVKIFDYIKAAAETEKPKPEPELKPEAVEKQKQEPVLIVPKKEQGSKDSTERPKIVLPGEKELTAEEKAQKTEQIKNIANEVTGSEPEKREKPDNEEKKKKTEARLDAVREKIKSGKIPTAAEIALFSDEEKEEFRKPKEEPIEVKPEPKEAEDEWVVASPNFPENTVHSEETVITALDETMIGVPNLLEQNLTDLRDVNAQLKSASGIEKDDLQKRKDELVELILGSSRTIVDQLKEQAAENFEKMLLEKTVQNDNVHGREMAEIKWEDALKAKYRDEMAKQSADFIMRSPKLSTNQKNDFLRTRALRVCSDLRADINLDAVDAVVLMKLGFDLNKIKHAGFLGSSKKIIVGREDGGQEIFDNITKLNDLIKAEINKEMKVRIDERKNEILKVETNRLVEEKIQSIQKELIEKQEREKVEKEERAKQEKVEAAKNLPLKVKAGLVSSIRKLWEKAEALNGAIRIGRKVKTGGQLLDPKNKEQLEALNKIRDNFSKDIVAAASQLTGRDLMKKGFQETGYSGDRYDPKRIDFLEWITKEVENIYTEQEKELKKKAKALPENSQLTPD